MRRVSSYAGLLGLVAATVLWQSLPAFADACDDDPTCIPDGGFGDPGLPGDGGSGIPGGFIALMVLVGLVGIGLAVYRISVARSMAEKAGMDPADATRVALLDDDGLSATYLASQMKGNRPGEPPPRGRTTAERLRELEGLKAQGLVTDEEYAQRRTAILGEV